jgi:Tfp pilus assembly protein PilX
MKKLPSKGFAAAQRALARTRRALARQDGFTMIVAMSVLMVTATLAVGAFAAANGDISVARVDQDRKQAFAAAEAAMNDYAFHLSDDPSYWSYCTTDPVTGAALPGVNQAWNGIGADPRTHQRSVPGGSGAYYKLELIPANGNTSCDPNNPTNTMIDSTTGTFRIRATGFYRAEKRSIVATFRRRGFLDYLYFTDYETSDPAWYAINTGGLPTRSPAGSSSGIDLIDWAGSADGCQAYRRDDRGLHLYNGEIYFSGSWHSFGPVGCQEIQFASADVVAGPLHTNDELLVCGTPDFGRTAQDRIEVSAAAPGWRGSGSCSNSPNFNGTFATSSPTLTLPPSNTTLKQLALPTYQFTGRTTIVLAGASMTVTNAARGLTNASMALPPNGIVYVDDTSCGVAYQPYQPYGGPTTCGDVIVKGTYSQSLTIAASNDIVINGNITHTGNSILGLIGGNFVRVYHPVDSSGDNAISGSSAPYGSYMQNVTIDAAILALNHSFTVDNYFSGNAMGTLTVNGAIAQKYRGPVGLGGSSVTHGYTKAYGYDDRLKFLSPPHFLDPVQAAWRIMRYSEQVPAR